MGNLNPEQFSPYVPEVVNVMHMTSADYYPWKKSGGPARIQAQTRANRTYDSSMGRAWNPIQDKIRSPRSNN